MIAAWWAQWYLRDHAQPPPAPTLTLHYNVTAAHSPVLYMFWGVVTKVLLGMFPGAHHVSGAWNPPYPKRPREPHAPPPRVGLIYFGRNA